MNVCNMIHVEVYNFTELKKSFLHLTEKLLKQWNALKCGTLGALCASYCSRVAAPVYILCTDLLITFHCAYAVACDLQSSSLRLDTTVSQPPVIFYCTWPVRNPCNRVYTLYDGPHGLYLRHATLPKGCTRPFGASCACKQLHCQGLLSPKSVCQIILMGLVKLPALNDHWKAFFLLTPRGWSDGHFSDLVPGRTAVCVRR